MAGGQDDVELNADQFIGRCAIFPKYLREGAFAEEALLSPMKLEPKAKPSSYAISVVSRSLLPSCAAVHAYGCRVAAKSNERKAAQFQAQGRVFERPRDTAHYQGFYDAQVAGVVAAANDHYVVRVVSRPENGETAHCHIEMHPVADATKDELSDARSWIIISIAARMAGPRTHTCDEDSDLADLFAQWPLPMKYADAV